MDITAKIETLKDMIMSSKRIAFLGGAGVSTESGIPDFRSENGYFEAIRRFGYPPEELLSHTFFMRHTDVFYKYYRKKAQPCALRACKAGTRAQADRRCYAEYRWAASACGQQERI